mmetsp:Transcript_14444/g.43381  ORF Transcript_14444/g.43381 Transcript_14444/m.43381 type:complete len:321 (+) Transcript_14444:2306-3268(+)
MALRRRRRRRSWSFMSVSISVLRSTRYAFLRSRVLRACSRFFARRYSSVLSSCPPGPRPPKSSRVSRALASLFRPRAFMLAMPGIVGPRFRPFGSSMVVISPKLRLRPAPAGSAAPRLLSLASDSDVDMPMGAVVEACGVVLGKIIAPGWFGKPGVKDGVAPNMGMPPMDEVSETGRGAAAMPDMAEASMAPGALAMPTVEARAAMFTFPDSAVTLRFFESACAPPILPVEGFFECLSVAAFVVFFGCPCCCAVRAGAADFCTCCGFTAGASAACVGAPACIMGASPDASGCGVVSAAPPVPRSKPMFAAASAALGWCRE